MVNQYQLLPKYFIPSQIKKSLRYEIGSFVLSMKSYIPIITLLKSSYLCKKNGLAQDFVQEILPSIRAGASQSQTMETQNMNLGCVKVIECVWDKKLLQLQFESLSLSLSMKKKKKKKEIEAYQHTPFDRWVFESL